MTPLKKKLIGGLIVAAGAGAVLIGVLSSGPESAENPYPSAPLAHALDTEGKEQVRQILVAKRADVAELLTESEFRQGKVESWQGGPNAEVIGGVVTLSFPKPLSVKKVDWPLISFPSEARPAGELEGVPPYLVRRFRVTADGIDEVRVYVDLGTGDVVGLLPGGDRAQFLEEKQLSGPSELPPAYHAPAGY